MNNLADFVTSWPLLALPAAGALYLILRLLKFPASKELRLLSVSFPGIILMIAWLILSGGNIPDSLIFIVPFVPTNPIMPIVCGFMLTSYLRQQQKVEQEIQKSEILTIFFLFVLYLYDQLIAYGAATSSD